MSALRKDQIVELASRYNYEIGTTRKSKILSLRSLIEQIKTEHQKITVKNAEALFDLIARSRPHMMGRDVEAYLSLISDTDVAQYNFPIMDRAQVQSLADKIPYRPPNSSNQYSSPTNTQNLRMTPPLDQYDATRIQLAEYQQKREERLSGHQTLSGVGNILGNSISLVFLVLLILVIIVAIGSIFS